MAMDFPGVISARSSWNLWCHRHRHSRSGLSRRTCRTSSHQEISTTARATRSRRRWMPHFGAWTGTRRIPSRTSSAHPPIRWRRSSAAECCRQHTRTRLWTRQERSGRNVYNPTRHSAPTSVLLIAEKGCWSIGHDQIASAAPPSTSTRTSVQSSGLAAVRR